MAFTVPNTDANTGNGASNAEKMMVRKNRFDISNSPDALNGLLMHYESQRRTVSDRLQAALQHGRRTVE